MRSGLHLLAAVAIGVTCACGTSNTPPIFCEPPAGGELPAATYCPDGDGPTFYLNKVGAYFLMGPCYAKGIVRDPEIDGSKVDWHWDVEEDSGIDSGDPDSSASLVGTACGNAIYGTLTWREEVAVVYTQCEYGLSACE